MTSPSRWTWLLGWIGGLAAVSAGLLTAVVGSEDPTVRQLLIVAVVGLGAWALLDRERIAGQLRSREFGLGAGSALLIALAGAVAVASYALADRLERTWDWTSNAVHTLSDQGVAAAAGLQGDVEVRAWFRPRSRERDRVGDLLELYGQHTPHLKVTWLDPLSDVRQAEMDAVTGLDGTLIFRRADGRQQRVEGNFDEARLNRALLMVASDAEHTVCWSVGHGEPDPDDTTLPDGAGSVVLALEGLNYQVRPVSTAVDGIDANCEVVVVARPTTDWSAAEREALMATVAAGRRAFVLIDPGLAPNLAADLGRMGVRVGDDVVLDFNAGNMLLGVNDPSFVVLSFGDLMPHAVTRDLGAAIVLGIARSVAWDDTKAGAKGLELLRTSRDAWAETTPDVDPVQPDVGVDRVGEVPVAVVATIEDPTILGIATRPDAAALAAPLVPTAADLGGATAAVPALGEAPAWKGVPEGFVAAPGGRVAVVGDWDFASNQYLALGNNRDLFLNLVAWLVEEEDQIAERPPEGDGLDLTVVSGALLALVELVLVPGLLAMGAVAVALRRRRL